MEICKHKLIAPGEIIRGPRAALRLVTMDDCTPQYVTWLENPETKQFLETRWSTQTLDSVREFVAWMLPSLDNYLMAIIERESGTHIGNIKVGPIQALHSYADVSYFVGDTAYWGKGYATEAIRLAADFAFARLGLHRVQAGLYEENVASAKALEKAGFAFEGRLRQKLRSSTDGGWQDHLWYGLLREDWVGRARTAIDL